MAGTHLAGGDFATVGDADVWVTNNADHTVARIDRRAMATIATIPVAH